MRVIAVTLSILSIVMIGMTMAGGLSAGHGESFFMSHLYWGFATLSVILVTLALALMFIFKMHGIIHDLIRQLDAQEEQR